MDENKLIDELGGTAWVAVLCDVTPGAVSQWKTSGIPKARLQFLRLALRIPKASESKERTVPFGYNNWRDLVMQKRRSLAYKAVSRAVRDGTIPPARALKCVDCGAPALCYDHRDYSKPLMIEPVCRRCNSIRGPGAPYLMENSEEYKALLEEAKRTFKGKVRKVR